MERISFLQKPKNQLILMLVLALGLNINTLFNEYAVDDAVILTNNSLVQKGIKGIPEIVSTDYFKGLGTLKGNELSGGRYRPLALIVFALEYQFFGANSAVSHAINLILFLILIVLLFTLLNKHLFSNRPPLLAFVTCLLFTAHPIHTEVIANVKSRDELIAFILLLISLISILKNQEKKSTLRLITALICFFLALLTKESSIAFIALVPLIINFFYNKNMRQSVFETWPLIPVFISYMVIRYAVIGFANSTSNLILNAPFLLATAPQAFATKVFILVKYLVLLVFPHPLSSDYSYNQIPYINIVSLQFIVSIAILLGLIASAFYSLRYKTLYSFSVLFFMITIFPVSNFIINIGAPMAERLLFQPSLAYCIIGASLFFYGNKKYKLLSNSILVIVMFLFSVKSIARNFEWKNNDTLYFADVETSPNSLRTNTYASESYLAKANAEKDSVKRIDYYNKTILYAEKAIAIYPKDEYFYMNAGSGYFGIGNYFKAADLWKKAYTLNSQEPEAKKAIVFISDYICKQGNAFHEKGMLKEAENQYKKAVEVNPENTDALYHLGGIYYLQNDTVSANKAWNKVMVLNPNYPIRKEEFLKK